MTDRPITGEEAYILLSFVAAHIARMPGKGFVFNVGTTATQLRTAFADFDRYRAIVEEALSQGETAPA